MDPEKAGRLGRKLLPAPAFRLARRLGIMVGAPIRYSFLKGHARSAWGERAEDPRGRPLPWYTYAAIDLLSNKDVAGRSVLEFGAGQSSLWWAGRGVTLTSLEDNAEWWQYVSSTLGNRATVLLTPTLADIPSSVLSTKYDLIVIDGMRRQDAAKLSIDLLAEGGAIVFDNSDGLWSDDDSQGRYQVVELMHGAGFSRVDFFGLSPGGISESCTSIYFRGRTFLFDSPEPPRISRY